MNKHINVLPDGEMRERDRTSLNRLPDYADWEPGIPLTDYMRELGQPVCIHRKSWEYGMCIHGLNQLGVVTHDAKALAVGAGSEPPLYYFANRVASMVATDLYDNPDHEGTPQMLANPRSFAPFPYLEDRLQVLQMPGDDLQFDDGTFDIVFCLSSIEHFGSRDTQRKSFDEMRRVLRKGGIACVITELILTEHTHDQFFTFDEIGEMFLGNPSMELVGGEIDTTISESLVLHPVDLNQSKFIRRSPHVVLKDADMLWTSLSLFFERM